MTLLDINKSYTLYHYKGLRPFSTVWPVIAFIMYKGRAEVPLWAVHADYWEAPLMDLSRLGIDSCGSQPTLSITTFHIVTGYGLYRWSG